MIYNEKETIKKFGENIKRYRTHLNLTQEKLAELCECSSQTISGTETGYSFPSSKVLFKLAEALELFAALGNIQELLRLIGTDITLFNRVLLAKLPVVLRFCVPNGQIDADKITLAEFADLILAVYCVNDVERILANFTKAVQSMPRLMQGLATSPR